MAIETDLPQPLVDAFVRGECVLFAGAGLSAQAGFPTWRPFLESLLGAAATRGVVSPDFQESLASALEAGQLDSVADSLVHAFRSSKEPFHPLLERIFRQPTPSLPQAHQLLRGLPFSAALTTNFDDLLERTWRDRPDGPPPVYTHGDTEQLFDALAQRRFFILKLYGELSQPETVLVAPDEFKRAVTGNLAFSQFMESLFFSKTLLFVGSSLAGIEGYLGGITFRDQEIPARHYALVAVEDVAWKTRAEVLRRRFGIQVLPYQPSDGFPELEEFLEHLVGPLATAAGAHFLFSLGVSPKEKKASEPRALRRARFENIGPFAEVELGLVPGWNLLLGDNGVGKSSLLKAIALAYCGEDAAPYSGRLLRGDSPNGTIVLRFEGGEEYTTRIFRRSAPSNNRSEVRSSPTRPLETENRLCLGFPPLRSVSWERATRAETDTRAQRPDVEDLLPLIVGAPDPRLDKLKQVILTLDHQARQESRGNGEPGREIEVIHKIFEVVGQLTEGLRLEFREVDAGTGEVWVETDDGRQRLEAVSQGTVSLLSWIGVLLQRLFQVHGHKKDWAEQSALVLIDEIDAHMHPEWQRKLVPKLRELFPKVQFIATTHSPLIVTDLEPDEIHVLRRDPVTRRIAVEQPRFELRGLRADQILTSSLFDLSTTRDLTTERAIERYRELVERVLLQPAEQRELEQIADQLKTPAPSTAERQEARQAFDFLEGAVLAQMQTVPEEKRRELLREVKMQLQQGVVGSRSS